MKSFTNTVIEKMNRMENFALRYDGGKTILWDINAPGLHVLLVAYYYLRFCGEKGKWSMLYHSYNDDFFNKVYTILNAVDLPEVTAPEIWGFIRKLDKYASANTNPEIRASTNVQLFAFIQDLLENTLYNEYLFRTSKKIRAHQDRFKELLVAADSFIVRGSDGYVRIMAGYPWFDQSWVRDTFISLPGLLLITERYEYAKSVFNFYAKQQSREGFLPNRIFSDGKKEYNSADGSLWFIEALNRYHIAVHSKDADNFVKKMIPTVNKIMDCYMSPTGDIHLDADNLVAVPAQWTWMDTAPFGNPVTPRYGKPVEIQGLFYNALGIAAKFNLMSGHKKLAQRYEELRQSVGAAINTRFFPEGRAYPLDVVDGDPHSDAVRPNALFLMSLSTNADLLPQERKAAIIDIVEKELLTRYGLRTLSPKDPRFVGRYDTFAPGEIKDLAYHQGAAWPYLVSHYVIAKRRAARSAPWADFKADVEAKMGYLMHVLADSYTLPELFSGDEPFTPGGAVSQAWSVGAMLEVFDILNIEGENFRCSDTKKTAVEQ